MLACPHPKVCCKISNKQSPSRNGKGFWQTVMLVPALGMTCPHSSNRHLLLSTSTSSYLPGAVHSSLAGKKCTLQDRTYVLSKHVKGYLKNNRPVASWKRNKKNFFNHQQLVKTRGYKYFSYERQWTAGEKGHAGQIANSFPPASVLPSYTPCTRRFYKVNLPN